MASGLNYCLCNFEELPVDGYLLKALNSSRKDRELIVSAENTILKGMQENANSQYWRLEFPPMNSYHRMLVHRVARYYDLEHLADGESKSVTVAGSTCSRVNLPIVRLVDLVEPSAMEPSLVPKSRKKDGDSSQTVAGVAGPPKITILRRNTPSAGSRTDHATLAPPTKAQGSQDNLKSSMGGSTAITKPIEQREREYELARQRIFRECEEAELATAVDPVQLAGGDAKGLAEPSADKEEMLTTKETIKFKGWGNLESIRPFIPNMSNQSAAPIPPSPFRHQIPVRSVIVAGNRDVVDDQFYPAEIPIYESAVLRLADPTMNLRSTNSWVDSSDVYVPKHILVIELRASARSREDRQYQHEFCRQQQAKLRIKAGSGKGLLVFSFQVESQLPQLQVAFASLGKLHPWHPKYLPEPPH